MKTTGLFFLALTMAAFAIAQENKAKNIVYPVTKKSNQSDDYFGTNVADPYRWLEDDTSAETAGWVHNQNKVTFDYLSQIPYRDKIKKRLTEVWNYEKYSTPFKKGDYYFFYKNDGIQNQSVLYIQDSLNGLPRIFLDPNKLSEDGTSALTNFTVSNDAKYAAYGVAKAGSDWKEFFVMNIKTGKKLDDHLEWIKFSGVSWKGDGFYYSRFDAPEAGKALSKKNEFSKVYYHKLGTSQAEDELIHQDKINPLRMFSANVTEDEKFMVLSETESTSGNALSFKELDKKAVDFIKIADGFEYDYDLIDNIGDGLLILTNDNAPRYRLILIDTKNPGKENWKNIIPEKKEVLESVSLCNGKIVATYMKDVTSRLSIYSIAGALEKEITLPGLGKVNGFSSDKKDLTAFYSFSTYIAPTIIYKYDIGKNTSEVYKKPIINFNSDNLETKQVFYTSKDGTKIPMFITHKKGIKLDGNNPTMLYGYGGFNISITPGFGVDKSVFLENGGVYAVANMRGGGEYGKEWHKAGTQLQKQNVFDDFIAAAEYLIKEKYTSSAKLAVSGRSNGGLLIGAVMTQRPDLFKVALPIVGVLDMLRYHKFTIGYAWATDYGSSDEEKHFKNLIKYSPLHNIKEGVNYPATLVMTGDHDDRVVPAHSFKFISTLQEKYKGQNPVLIRIDVNAGHGSGKPTSKQIEESADLWAFVFYNLGMELK